jgi:hypothetical protein
LAEVGSVLPFISYLGRVARNPSLLSFLQDRLSQDIDLILSDTPIFGLEVNDPEFERRFLERGALLQRVRTDQALIAMTIAAMQDEQGSPPAGANSFVSGPVTALGSDVLKTMAARYADHPDYQADW